METLEKLAQYLERFADAYEAKTASVEHRDLAARYRDATGEELAPDLVAKLASDEVYRRAIERIASPPPPAELGHAVTKVAAATPESPSRSRDDAFAKFGSRIIELAGE